LSLTAAFDKLFVAFIESVLAICAGLCYTVSKSEEWGTGTVNRGVFIVFEGIDGAGKTTQAELLRNRLTESGRRVHMTAEPTDMPTGVALRRVLSGKVKKSESEAALMFVQDRVAHNLAPENGIEACLAKGIDVICDRYYYSTMAYQGSSVDYGWVRSMNLDCPDIRKPDLCIFLDLTPEQSLGRIAAGRQNVEIYENRETLSRVRQAFLGVLNDLEGRERIVIVDAHRDIGAIHADIVKAVEDILT